MNGFGAFDIKLFIFSLTVWMTLLWAGFAHGQTVIYQDDFEGAVSGWSDNSTDFAPAVTNFLGRFASGQTTTSRTFTVPPNTDELVIEFDLYRFDSWDNQAEFGFDRFEVEIDGTQIFSLPFPNPQASRSGTAGNVEWSHTPLTGREELGFNSGQFWFDQLHRFEIIVDNPGASVSLTLRAALSQIEPDESAGYDNFLVTANAAQPGGAGAFCPAGTNVSSGVFHVLSATGADNPNNAVGAPLLEGSQDTGANSGTTFFPSVIYDLTNDPNIFVPEGTRIQVSLGDHFSGNAEIAISSALDNTNFPPPGSTGSQTVNLNSNNNTFIYFDYTVPAGGARFIELDHQFGGIRFDGVIFDTLCTPPPAVIVEAENDNGSVADSSFGNTPVLNVLNNDTIDGITPPPAFTLALAAGSSLSSGVTFDTATGAVGILQDTLTGVYSFDYELCQAGLPTNCDTATVTINVTNPNPPMICPAGTTPIAGTFHVVGVTPVNGSPTNPNGALGAPLPEGSQDNNSAVTGVTFFQNLIYDLTGDPDIIVPEGTAIDVSLANHFNSNAIGNISASLDGNNYTALGTSNAPWVNNTFRYDEYIVPNGGARFLQIEYGFGGGLRFDGVIYNTQCEPSGAAAPTLSAAKTVDVYDPQTLGLYAIPGNDVIYTITVENTGAGEIDSGSLILIDFMPPEVSYFNGDIDDGGPETDPVAFETTSGGLTLDFAADVGFSDAATQPTNFANCTYTPAAGYDPDVTYICFNPKGVMSGQSTMSVSFRARIE